MSLKVYVISTLPRPSGEYEVHSLTECHNLPDVSDRYRLGLFLNCEQALKFAKRSMPGLEVDGCEHCMPECHSRSKAQG